MECYQSGQVNSSSPLTQSQSLPTSLSIQLGSCSAAPHSAAAVQDARGGAGALAHRPQRRGQSQPSTYI